MTVNVLPPASTSIRVPPRTISTLWTIRSPFAGCQESVIVPACVTTSGDAIRVAWS